MTPLFQPRSALVISALAALVLSACTSQPPAPEQKGADVTDASRNSVATLGNVNGQGNLGQGSADPLNDPRNPLYKKEIYFDYDSFVVKDEYRGAIAAHANYIKSNPKFKVLIQGNTDERGSREYNVSLGQKRAEAVKKALLLNNVREDQLEAVSLGEEKPRCSDATEECWAQNRRADLVYER